MSIFKRKWTKKEKLIAFAFLVVGVLTVVCSILALTSKSSPFHSPATAFVGTLFFMNEARRWNKPLFGEANSLKGFLHSIKKPKVYLICMIVFASVFFLIGLMELSKAVF